MGSGISLDEKQIADIIKRQLIKKFEEEQTMLPLYTDDGHEIYRDFSDEVRLNNIIKEVYLYANYDYKNKIKNKK